MNNKTIAAALFFVTLYAASAQTNFVRLSNLVETAYFTNDDRVVIYRGTNPPYVLRGSNLWLTLQSQFVTNSQPQSIVSTNLTLGTNAAAPSIFVGATSAPSFAANDGSLFLSTLGEVWARLTNWVRIK